MSTKENAQLLRLCRSWSTTTWALRYIHMNWSLMGNRIICANWIDTTWSRNTWRYDRSGKQWLNRVTLLQIFVDQKLLVSSLPAVSWSRWVWQPSTGKLLKKWAFTNYGLRWQLVAGCTSVLKGIVHGYLQLLFPPFLNAGRLKLSMQMTGDLTIKPLHFIWSQWDEWHSRKAAEIAKRLPSLQKWTLWIETRHSQGWD